MVATNADVRSSTPGYRWSVASHHNSTVPVEGKPGWVTAGPADYYFLTCGNTLEDAAPRRHFKTQEKAEQAAQKLNEADVFASLQLSNTEEDRLRRFKTLVGDSHHWFHDSQWWWTHKRGRYALYVYDGDGSCYWTTEDDPGEVRGEIEGGDVERIVDLDTGEDMSFSRHVSVEFAG
jgi:hypothetical protein